MRIVDPHDLPSGILAIMFTDIEDSTSRWEADPPAMRTAITFHDDLIDAEIGNHQGRIFKSTGDGVAAVFDTPDHAAQAAVAIQQRFQSEAWPGVERLKVRIGVHLGHIEPTGSDYYGPPVNRAARITDVANGDQIATSKAAAQLITSVTTRPMGPHLLKGIGTESIVLIDSDVLVADPRPLRARVSRAVKPLPPATYRTVGREHVMARIIDALATSPVTTVIGPGGVGKTHLALQAGRQAQQHFTDGAVLVELSAVTDERAVLDAVAEAIGARLQPNMSLRESLVNFLEGRDLLMILDTCEHVLGAIRELGELIAPLENVRILATSRERIGLPGERVVTLAPLDPATVGVELFIERARDRDVDQDFEAADRSVIASICHRLDGIPLGIELAAAWIGVLSPTHLLERLDDRFAMLDRPSVTGTRHTLRQTVQWSYDQLGETQARLFDRLSVFADGFSFEAAAEVCSGDRAIDAPAILEALRSLVDKSIIVSERGTGQIRFRMLDTIRQFGEEQLDRSGDLEDFRRRHAQYFLDAARREAERLVSRHEAEVWDRLDREWANIRSAFFTLVALDKLDEAAELVTELGWFAGLSMRFELFAWAEELATVDDFDSRPWASSIYGLLAVNYYFTIDQRTGLFAQRGLALNARDHHGFCRIALTADALNNVHSAEDSDERTRAWLEYLDDDSPMMSRLWALGMRVFHVCTHAPSAEAAGHHAEMVQIAETSGSATAMALARWAGGMVASYESLDTALAHWRSGVDSAASISDVHLLTHLIVGLELHFTSARGDLDEALELCLSVLSQAHAQHYMAGTSHLFGVTAIILARVDRAETGAALLGSMVAHGHIPRDNAMAAIERSLGPRSEAAQRAGRMLSTNAAVAMAVDALSKAIAERASVHHG